MGNVDAHLLARALGYAYQESNRLSFGQPERGSIWNALLPSTLKQLSPLSVQRLSSAYELPWPYLVSGYSQRGRPSELREW
jgi:hypothetical protein